MYLIEENAQRYIHNIWTRSRRSCAVLGTNYNKNVHCNCELCCEGTSISTAIACWNRIAVYGRKSISDLVKSAKDIDSGWWSCPCTNYTRLFLLLLMLFFFLCTGNGRLRWYATVGLKGDSVADSDRYRLYVDGWRTRSTSAPGLNLVQDGTRPLDSYVSHLMSRPGRIIRYSLDDATHGGPQYRNITEEDDDVDEKRMVVVTGWWGPAGQWAE